MIRREKAFACLVYEDKNMLYLMFNANTVALDFVLPSLPDKMNWQVIVNTSCNEVGHVETLRYRLENHASAIFLAK